MSTLRIIKMGLSIAGAAMSAWYLYKNGKKDGYEDGKKDTIRYGKWINEPPYTAEGKYLKGQECSVCHSIKTGSYEVIPMKDHLDSDGNHICDNS